MSYDETPSNPISEVQSDAIFDTINITSISSNTILLSFWVHSKYQLSSITDSSSSIVNKSSGIMSLLYIVLIIIYSFTYNDPSNTAQFILYQTNESLHRQNTTISRCNSALLIMNGISFLMMLNFYFICIKEVVLRKHHAQYFQGKK